VFAIQDEIARTIVSTLRTTFLADIADPAPQRYTRNLEAYSLYLKGRFCWNKRNQQGVLEAISFFKQAIDHDPTTRWRILASRTRTRSKWTIAACRSPKVTGSRANTRSRR